LSFAGALLVALGVAAPSLASVASEQAQGSQILSGVHAGTLKGKSLSSSQYEQVGEYLMGQALGSTTAHGRMNALMADMVGSAAGDQMHRYIGERYLGKSAQIQRRDAPMYGLIGMMMVPRLLDRRHDERLPQRPGRGPGRRRLRDDGQRGRIISRLDRRRLADRRRRRDRGPRGATARRIACGHHAGAAPRSPDIAVSGHATAPAWWTTNRLSVRRGAASQA